MSEEKEYKTDVLFLRQSKAGKHLFMFDREGNNGKSILGEGVKSLLINVEDVQQLLGGGDFVKVSVMREDKQQQLEGGSL